MLFFWLAILLFFVAPIMLGGVFGGRRYGRGRGRGPVVIWGPGIGGGWGGGRSGGGWGGGGFSGGGGGFGGGGASGGWRTEGRRVGKECVSTCSNRFSASH